MSIYISTRNESSQMPPPLFELPVEVFNLIFSNIDSTADLISLSTTCQRLDALTIPFLYRHTVLTIPHSDADISGMEEQVPEWMVLLRALSRNGRKIAIHVKKLTIRNPTPFDKHNGLDYHDDSMPGQSKVACYNPEVLENNKLAYLINSLLEVAIRRMKNLTDFAWTAENVYPTNSVFEFIRSPLSSFSFHYPYYPQPLTHAWPSHFNPAPPCHKLDSITSLSISGIPSKQAVKHISGLLVSLRNQLEVLRLGFPDVPWELGSENIWNLYSRNSSAMDLRDDPIYKDHLFPIIEELIELNEPIKLHTLEVDYITELNVKNWAKAFDFNTIEKFSLTHTHTVHSSPVHLAPEMWRYFRQNGITFKSFKTSCDPDDEELSKYMMSFESLAEMYYCSFHFTPTFLDVQGHFHSLRALFCPIWHPVESDPGTFLPKLIEGAPNLEELAIPMSRSDQKIYFQAFSQARSLKRLYIVLYKAEWVTDPLVNPQTFDKFIRTFFNYYRENPCPFFSRLERISCFRTLWELVPLDLTCEEQEEMEYELSTDPVLDAFPVRDPDPETPNWPRTEPDGFDLLEEPYCYSWERALSGFEKMPMRVDWDDYWEDEMVSTVYNYIMIPFFGELIEREVGDWNEQVVIDGFMTECEDGDDNENSTDDVDSDYDYDDYYYDDDDDDDDDESEDGNRSSDKGDGETMQDGDEKVDNYDRNEDGGADYRGEDASQQSTENDDGVESKNILPIHGAKEGEREDFA